MSAKLLVFLFLSLAGQRYIFNTHLFAQFVQQGPKLVGSGAVGSLVYQGTSSAISSDGNTAIVGGFGDNNYAGAVWVFTRSTGVWTQQGPKLIGTGAVGIAGQGGSVAISYDGNTAIVGGYNDNSSAGAIWIFTRSGGVWTQQGSKLVGTGGDANSFQGISVAISSDGNTAIEGGFHDNNNVGAVWVFIRSGGVWTQQGLKLIGTSGLGSEQGRSVAISSDGNTLVEGGFVDNGSTGAVWVFIRNGGVWTQQGTKLVGTGGVGAEQGTSIGISSDGNTAIEGGYFDNNQTGAVWVFTRSGDVWTQQGNKLVGTGAVGTSRQGISSSISSDGNTIIDGGYIDNSNQGAVWVFTRSGSVWTQQGLKLIGTGAVGSVVWQGNSVAISSDGSTFIEGGDGDNNSAGAVWVFYNSTVGINPISNEVPKKFSLSQNYPNPFNPSTKIKFDIPSVGQSHVFDTQLKIYDVLGKEVATLVNQQLKAGTYEVNWPATSGNASNFPSGVYFYKLVAGDFVATKKMILMK